MAVAPAKDAYVLDIFLTALCQFDGDRDSSGEAAADILKALLAMPAAQRADLAERLLLEPPVDQVKHAMPLILYFVNDADRREMIDVIHEVKPGMVAYRI